MKSLFYYLLSLTVLSSYAQDTTNSFLIKYYTEKAQNYLDKEKALSTFYKIDKSGIAIYASGSDRLADKTEFFLEWKQLNDYKSAYKIYNTAFEIYKQGKYDQPIPRLITGNPNEKVDYISTPEKKLLEGHRIAIDPGHIADNHLMGDLEKKHIKFPRDLVNGMFDSVEISEGMLTYATAILLKQKLEAEGAEVMITRKDGTTAFDKTYAQWKKDDLKLAVDSLFRIGELKPSQKNYFSGPKAQDRDIFRVIFRDLDLAKRAELINTFRPELTVIIHFNVDETNLEWTKPSAKDMNMTFVGGAFMKNDLSNIEKRFEFLRLLINDDLERSIALSTAVVDAFEKNLDVPTADVHDAKYIAEGCMLTGKKGVYCRNLQLTRYIHSPLVYGETLFQDNIKESQLLNKETDKTKNERLQQVANAYYEGILKYLKIKK